MQDLGSSMQTHDLDEIREEILAIVAKLDLLIAEGKGLVDDGD